MLNPRSFPLVAFSIFALSSCSDSGADDLSTKIPGPGDPTNGDNPSGSGASSSEGTGAAPGSGGDPTNTTSGGNGSGASESGGSTSTGGIDPGGPLGTGETPFPIPVSLPLPEPAVPCPAGSRLVKVSAGDYYSWPGTVFGSVMPTGEGQNHDLKKLEVRVEDESGTPVEGCEVRLEGEPGNGWGHGATATTGADGSWYGYWTAGDPGQNNIDAVILLEGSGDSRVSFSGTVDDNESRTDSVHLNYDVDPEYTEAKIRISPMAAGAATYFSALNWKDSYAGIQFDDNVHEGVRTIVIFSVWDAGGEEATLDDVGDCNLTHDFAGEGTGTSCRLVFPPSTHGSVAGLPDDYMLQLGHTYELHLITGPASGNRTVNSLTFTDITRGIGPISLGSQSTGTDFEGGRNIASFVKEWTSHGSCLSAERSVFYHGLEYRVGTGPWQFVNEAIFTPNYVNTNNEICGNYLAQAYDGKFFVSSGGMMHVGRPYVPGDDLFPKRQPPMVVAPPLIHSPNSRTIRPGIVF